MPLATDVMGTGQPALFAKLIGVTPTTLVTTGTSATTAATIQSKAVTLTTASSQTGAILPSDAPLWNPYFVTNPTSDTGIIYPHSGAQLNGGTATTGGQNLAQNKTAIYIRTGTLLWISILTA